MKYKFISIIAALALLLCSCVSDSAGADDYNIVVSFTPIYAVTLSLTDGAQGVSTVCMTSNTTGCLHDYQVSPSDMKAAETADLFIIGGAGMEESFIDRIYEQYPKLDVFDSSFGTKQIAGENEVNSHLWLSLENAVKIAENICGALCDRDEKNKDIYTANLEKFKNDMTALYDEYYPVLVGAGNKKIITFHESFEYLADEFGIEVAGVIEAEPGTAPDPQTLSGLIELAKTGSVAAIFTEPQYPDATARVISDETGVPVYSLDPIVTGEMTADSFITVLKQNLETLASAMNRE